MIRLQIKRWLKPLRNTPLHPQWLIFRELKCHPELYATLSGTVFDIGCGERLIRKSIPSACHYIGMDYWTTANEWYHTRPDLYCDAANLPVVDTCADHVLLLSVLEHLPTPQMAIKEIARALKPGGTLIAQIPYIYPMHDAPLDFHRWSCHGIVRLLNEAGMEAELIDGGGNAFSAPAVLTNLALANAIINALRNRHPSLPLLMLLLPLVPIINISAFALSKIAMRDTIMPLTYHVLAKKAPVR